MQPFVSPLNRVRILIAMLALTGAVVRAASAEITNVTPSRGPVTGGTTVFISGTGFTGATQVLFGATPAASFVVNNDTSIQAVTPATAAAVLNVSVVTPSGTVTLNEAFGFGPLPVAFADSYSTPFGTSLSVGSPGVLSNDDPSGGGGVVVELGDNVTNGTLSLTADGGFTYVPNSGFAGTDRFTYRSRNSTGFSNVGAVTIAVGTPSGPLPPSALQVVSVLGNRLTLRWTPPAVGPAPTSYVIEGGGSSGEVAGSVVAGSVPVFTFDAPTGAFFLRVRSVVGATQSAPSNEVQVFVNVPAAPSAPDQVLALVNDTNLALTWRNTFAGGAPTALVLDVSGSLSTSIPLALSDTLSFAGVLGGTYTLALRALNAFGSSAQSAPLTLTFPGPCSGAPQAPANFVAYKNGNTIQLLWDAPATGAAPTGYTLNVSGSFTGSFTTTSRAMTGTVGPGTYLFSVAAFNTCGASTATQPQAITIP
jgi:hypothetical protein